MRHISPYSDKINRKENPLVLLVGILSIFSIMFILAFI